MLEWLQYDFMVRALLAGSLVAISVPILGIFLVSRRYSLIADGLSHVSLAGVGLGLVLGIAPIAVAVPVAAAGAIILEWLRQRQRLSGEISLAILMSGGLALAVVLASLAKGIRVDFNSYLFGSITTTTWYDLAWLLGLTVITVVVVASQYHALIHMSFDEDSAKIAGHNVGLLSYFLVILTAVMVVLSLRIVGGLLISAMLVVPVVAASQLAKSFTQALFLSCMIAGLAVFIGLLAAFYAGVAAGGAIVLSALALLLLSMLLKP